MAHGKSLTHVAALGLCKEKLVPSSVADTALGNGQIFFLRGYSTRVLCVTHVYTKDCPDYIVDK